MSQKDEIGRRMEKFARLVESGSSFAQAVETLAPPLSLQLMRRASAARVFDRDMFDAVIAADAKTTFDKFILNFGVERTHPKAATYRVAATIAADHLESWIQEQKGREELSRFMGRVYQYLREQPDTPATELLRFLIASDPEEGYEEFERQFRKADEAFDLARCHALVQMLKELDNFGTGMRSVPLRMLSKKLRSRCDALVPYVAARGRFIEEYVKSTNYLQRRRLFKEADAFLGGKESGMFPLYGAGGSGKTMFLQWLVARHCLPLPDPIPVAKVDFDDINVAKLQKFPWLILVRLAEQLNRQISGSPLGEYLERYAEFLPILLPTAALAGGLRVEGLESELELSPELSSQAQQEFAYQLPGQRVVLILDTLENASLHFPNSLRALLAMFKEVLSAAGTDSRIKLILSGRYDLQKAGFLGPNDPRPKLISKFSRDEADRYLRDVRHVDPKLIQAIVVKANGNPFILALIADLVVQQDITDVKHIEELKPEFAYLIRRVIDRIPDSQRSVRWVVRYGVIPRRLTREFLKNVMEGPLRRELEGDKSESRDRVKDYHDSFPRGGSVDVDALWAALRGYADTTGWLRAGAGELRFQPEVVEPMRELLRQEPDVYEDLHRAAVKWFESSAREGEPRRWAELMAEAFYHRLQLRDPDLEPWLKTLLAEPQAQTPTARRELLTAVTTLLPPSVAVPLGTDDRPLFSQRLLGRAHLDLAKLGAGIQWGACRIEQDPSGIRQLLINASGYLLPSEERYTKDTALVEMALAVNDRDYDRALRFAEKFQSEPLGSREKRGPELYSFNLLMARLLVGKKDPRAEEFYLAAQSALKESGQPTWDVMTECGRELYKMGYLAEGLSVLDLAIEELGGEATGALLLEDAEQSIEVGEYAKAESLAESAGKLSLSEAERFRLGRVLMLCDLARGRVSDAGKRLFDLRPSEADQLQVIQMQELRGEHDAALYYFDHAIMLLQKAASDYAAAGEGEEAARAMLRAVRVSKDLKGDWASALLTAQRWISPGSDFLALEHAHLAHLVGKAGDDAPPYGEPVKPPWVRAALRLLTRDPDVRDRDLLREIVEHLAQVRPPSRRYAYLHFFRWLPILKGGPDLEYEFLRLLPEPKRGTADFFPRALTLVEIYRCLGSKFAHEVLERAFVEADGSVYLYERLIEAAQRCGGILPPVVRVFESCQSAESNELGAATKIRLQAILLEGGDVRAEMIANILEPELPEGLRGTQFEAMHLVNLSRLAPEKNKEAVREHVREAAAVLLELGRREERARLLDTVQEAETVAPSEGRRGVVTMSSLPNLFESVTHSLASFESSRVLLDEPELVIASMLDALGGAQNELIVELESDDSPAVSLPWEWATSKNQFFYRSAKAMRPPRVNPFARAFWPRLPMALRRLIGSIWPVRIMILHPPVSFQERIGRGHDISSRRTLAEIYQSHGSKTFEPVALATEFISQEIRSSDPHLIHIQAPVVERRGQLAIDLPLEDSPTAGLLGVDFWVQQLRMVKAGPPVIILDPPRPRSGVEVSRQLLLRNRFAADLAAKGRARAVLCTGLFDPDQLELVAERLAQLVAVNPQFKQLLALLQRGLSGDLFSTKGTALFVRDLEALLK